MKLHLLFAAALLCASSAEAAKQRTHAKQTVCVAKRAVPVKQLERIKPRDLTEAEKDQAYCVGIAIVGACAFLTLGPALIASAL